MKPTIDKDMIEKFVRDNADNLKDIHSYLEKHAFDNYNDLRDIHSEIQKHACGYADLLRDIYSDKDHTKCKRVKTVTQFLWFKNREKFMPSVIDIGCGPGYIALQMAKSLDCNVDAVDFSPDECRNANLLKEDAVKHYQIRPQQMNIYLDDIFDPKTEIAGKKYDLVFCADIIASYARNEKINLARKLFDYKADDGSVLVTSLCCEDEALAEKYANGDIIQYKSGEEIIKVPLFTETPEFYISLFEDISGKKVEHKRLDKECVLFYM